MNFDNFWKIFGPIAAVVATGVLTIQQTMGVNHPTIIGSIATALLGLVSAKAVQAAHS